MDFPFVVYRMFDSRGGESQISMWNADIIGKWILCGLESHGGAS